MLIFAGPLLAEERPARFDAPFTPEQRLANEAKALYALGILHAREERLLQAVGALEGAALLDPSSPAIRRELIPVYIALGRPDDARKACAVVLQADPQDYDSRFHKAKLEAAAGQLSDAIADLRIALASPHLKEVPERRFVLQGTLTVQLERARDLAGAAQSQAEVAAIFTRYRHQLMENGVLSEQRIVGRQAEALEYLGRLQQERGLYAEAVVAFQQAGDLYRAMKDENDRAGALRLGWHLSDIAFQSGDYAKSLKLLDEYISFQTDDAAPFARKAELLRKLDRAAEILPLLRRELAQRPLHRGLKLLYARELGRSGQIAAAERLFDELIEATATPEPVRELFAMEIERGRPEAVFERYDRLVAGAYPPEDRYSPARANAQRLLPLFALAFKGNREIAAPAIAAAVALAQRNAPGQAFTWYTIGQHARSFRDFAAAEALLRKALATDAPPSPVGLPASARTVLTDVYMESEQWQKAVAAIDGMLAAAPPPAPASLQSLLWNLADAQNRLGRWDDALKSCDRLLAKVPADRRTAARCLRGGILARAGRAGEAKAEFEGLLNQPLGAADLHAVRRHYAAALELLDRPDEAERQRKLK